MPIYIVFLWINFIRNLWVWGSLSLLGGIIHLLWSKYLRTWKFELNHFWKLVFYRSRNSINTLSIGRQIRTLYKLPRRKFSLGLIWRVGLLKRLFFSFLVCLRNFLRKNVRIIYREGLWLEYLVIVIKLDLRIIYR